MNVETKRINEAVKNNLKRFSKNFCFQLTKTECENLRCKNFTSKSQSGRRYNTRVFTKEGAMLSIILKSKYNKKN